MVKEEEHKSLWQYFVIASLVFVLAVLCIFYWQQHTAKADSLAQTEKPAEPIVRRAEAQGGGPEDDIAVQKVLEYKLIEGEEKKGLFLKLSAESALVADLNTGKVLYAKNPHQCLFPASTTKIVTAMVSKNIHKDTDKTTVSSLASSQEPNVMGLKTGDTLSIGELLDGLLINSGNDAAMALAEADSGGRDKFIQKMNNLVQKLGLSDTNFENPSGLHSNNHYSSAYDLSVLMRYLDKNYPTLLPIMGTQQKIVSKTDMHSYYYLNTLSTILLSYPGIEAVKTGYTPEAGHTWVAIAKKDNKRIIVTFFSSWQSSEDAKKLLDFGLSL